MLDFLSVGWTQHNCIQNCVETTANCRMPFELTVKAVKYWALS